MHAWVLPRNASEDDPDAHPTSHQSTPGKRALRTDGDARWGYKTATNGDPNSDYFGYSLVGLVPVSSMDGEKLPAFTARVSLAPAASDIVAPVLHAVDSLTASGHAVLELLADRAFSYRVPENWCRPLRERGVETVFDLHAADRGPYLDPATGALWIDGWPYCPETPERLRKIKPPERWNAKDPEKVAKEQEAKAAKRARNRSAKGRARYANSFRQRAELTADRRRNEAIDIRRRKKKVARKRQWEDLQRFQSEREELSHYALRRVAGPDETGKERFEDPAWAQRLACPNCPMSLVLNNLLPEDEKLPIIHSAPHSQAAGSPAVCKQRTHTVPGTVQEKKRQRLPWGSDEWIASYNRRSRVEGVFGNWKSPSGGDIKRGWTQIVGLVGTALMAVTKIVAMNINAIREWAKKHSTEIAHAVFQKATEQEPNEGHHDSSLGEDSGGTSPPLAA